MPSRRTPERPSSSRGFTLIELMTVVVIVGLLAVLATYGVRKYVLSAKASEAIQMIGSIKAAQENFKDETFAYLDVSGSLTNYYPAAPTKHKRQWGGGNADLAAKWRRLGVSAAAPVQFGYACTAGTATQAPTPLSGISVGDWPSAAQGEPWYVVQAAGDLDGDGVTSIYVSASFTGQIFSEREDE